MSITAKKEDTKAISYALQLIEKTGEPKSIEGEGLTSIECDLTKYEHE